MFSTLMVPVTGVAVTVAWALASPAGASWSEPTSEPRAGTVAITTDHRGAALFAEEAMRPGDRVRRCLTVTYTGSLIPADISLYGRVSGSGLDAYLDLEIDLGDGGDADCLGFQPAERLFSGTLGGFAASHADFASGIEGWSPTASAETRTYRFTLTLWDDNAAQGKIASATFIWEAVSP